MRLTGAPRGEDPGLVAAPDEGAAWSLLIALDERAWSEEAGDWGPGRAGMLRVSITDGSGPQPPPCWTKTAAIAHSYDAPAAVGPA
jgi:hypothetical protein